jgi:hypothetical protein
MECWVAIRTDGFSGTGTQADPYDGSTAAKFDALMRSFPAYSVIHLGPGTFLTYGVLDSSAGTGFVMKKGQQIVGAGMDVTIVKLMHCFQFSGRQAYEGDVFVVPYNVDGSGSLVSDLTVDLNSDYFANQLGVSAYRTSAVVLRGNNCTIRNVHAIHGHGDWGSLLEAFILYIYNYYDRNLGAWQPVTGALIANCLVDQTNIGYGSAIDLLAQGTTPMSGTIRNNTVKDWTGEAPYGCSGQNILIQGNTSINCPRFFMSDSGVINGLTISGNTMQGVKSGVYLIPGFSDTSYSNIVVENNQASIYVPHQGDADTFLALDGTHHPGYLTNITCRNNQVTLAPGSIGNNYYSFYMLAVDTVYIYGNVYDRTPTSYYDATVTNFWLNGVFVH